MQARYYAEGMATLRSWTQKDIDGNKRYYEMIVDSLMCKVHSHDENPLLRLYDMEG
jgi:hypothetical protein